MFRDEVTILCRSAFGGSGSAKLAKKKYQPLAGPDGGNGGEGGDVVFIASSQLENLSWFARNRDNKAGAGEDGGDNGRTGHKGKNCELTVPIGSRLFNHATGLLLAELLENGQQYVALKGGKGGLGNIALATATRRAPTVALPGQAGEEMSISICYRLISDIAIIDTADLNFPVFELLHQKPINNPHIYYQAPLKQFAVLNYNKYPYVILPYSFKVKSKKDAEQLEYETSFRFLEHLYYSKILVFSLPDEAEAQIQILKDLSMSLHSIDSPYLKAIICVNNNLDFQPTIEQHWLSNRSSIIPHIIALSELEKKLVELLNEYGI